MKVLLCCLRAPYPPMGGVELRCWQVLNILAGIGEAGLFALAGPAEPPPAFPGMRWRIAEQSPSEDPASQEWMSREHGLPSDSYYDDRTAAALRQELERFAPDVVVFDHLWMHTYMNEAIAAGARVVLNTHNVEADLARELAASERHPAARMIRRRFAQHLQAREGQALADADQIWVCSDEDCERIQRLYAVETPVRVVANAVDTASYRGPLPARPDELSGPGPFLLFPGAFFYAPNQRAASFLIQELLPRVVSRHPNVRLVLAGRDPTPEMQAASGETVIVTGAVPDMTPYFRHSTMMLAPLFEGGGTRFKIIEAFAARLPVICTTKAAEGLGADNRHLLVANDADAFAARVDEALTADAAQIQRVQAAAGFAESFSWESVGNDLHAALAELLA